MSERSQDVSSYAVCMWKIHVNLMNDLFHLNLSKSPALCVLGLLPDSMNLSGRQRLWVHLAVMTGCRIILHHLTLVEQVMYRVKGRDIFNQVWGPFLPYMMFCLRSVSRIKAAEHCSLCDCPRICFS